MKSNNSQKTKNEPDGTWKICVKVWFDFFKEKYNGNEPTFMGAAAGCFKKLVKRVKDKSIAAGMDWNEMTAQTNMMAFFNRAYNHQDSKFQNYIRQNFTIPILLYNFDKITVFNEESSTQFHQFANIARQAGVFIGG